MISVEGAFLEKKLFIHIILSLQSIFQARTFLERQKKNILFLLRDESRSKTSTVSPPRYSIEVDDKGKIKDNATPELARIRKRLNEERSRIRRLVDQVFRQASSEGWTPDGVSPTIRDGRLVIHCCRNTSERSAELPSMNRQPVKQSISSQQRSSKRIMKSEIWNWQTGKKWFGYSES
ncbi:MAG: hypothetical protein WDO15_23045 [Bacteroidota bacterium]